MFDLPVDIGQLLMFVEMLNLLKFLFFAHPHLKVLSDLRGSQLLLFQPPIQAFQRCPFLVLFLFGVGFELGLWVSRLLFEVLRFEQRGSFELGFLDVRVDSGSFEKRLPLGNLVERSFSLPPWPPNFGRPLEAFNWIGLLAQVSFCVFVK